ncbi:MAG: tyrosine-type recombinase/integrase [Peptococcaceae bacterium]|nr:tyrosine-type recombinase/integrase [Peptococcaceae bacterium]
MKQVATATRPVPKWLTRAEQAALFHVIHGNDRDMAIFGLMLHAGLLVSEVCHLVRGDIRISDRKGTVRIRQGKGNKFREVPLSKTLRKILAAWLEQNPEGPLFPNRCGQPITISGIEKLLAEYAYRAKLEEITPHRLRHAFCKNLVDLGVPLDQVAMLAGHASLDVTKRYTTPSMADLQSAVDRTAWE